VKDGPTAVKEGPTAVKDGPTAVKEGPTAVKDGPTAQGVKDGPTAVKDGPTAHLSSLARLPLGSNILENRTPCPRCRVGYASRVRVYTQNCGVQRDPDA
jgi:hypothetical protein